MLVNLYILARGDKKLIKSLMDSYRRSIMLMQNLIFQIENSKKLYKEKEQMEKELFEIDTNDGKFVKKHKERLEDLKSRMNKLSHNIETNQENWKKNAIDSFPLFETSHKHLQKDMEITISKIS